MIRTFAPWMPYGLIALGVFWIVHCSSGPCDPGWYYRNGMCFYFHKDDVVTWNDANDSCSNQNASLVNLNYQQLYDYIKLTATTVPLSNFWIGLRRTDDFEFRHLDESTATNLTWQVDEPDHEFEACTFVNNGLVYDDACYTSVDTTTGYVCEHLNGCPTNPHAVFHSERDIMFGSTCLTYELFADAGPPPRKFSWQHCRSSCPVWPGRLVHLTLDMHNHIKGINWPPASVIYWIGAKTYKDDIFYWANRTLNTMTSFWATGEPNDVFSDCVYMDDAGYWYDSSCDVTKNYICEKEAYPFDPTTTIQPTTTQLDCRCKCSRLGKRKLINMTMAEVFLAVQKLKSELAVNKSSLSSFIRRKISASDSRASSAVMGYIGTAILCVTFGSIVVADLPQVYRGIRHRITQFRLQKSSLKTNPQPAQKEAWVAETSM